MPTARSFIKEGKIVPVEVTVKLLLAAMEKHPGKKFLIDGFPRSMDNKDGWYQVVGDQAEVAFCLFYDCPEEELEKRLLKRGETSGRDDDNIESIKKRFRTFRETSMPVVEWFEARGQLRKVSSAQGVEEVWAATRRILDGAGVFPADAPPCKVGRPTSRTAEPRESAAGPAAVRAACAFAAAPVSIASPPAAKARPRSIAQPAARL